MAKKTKITLYRNSKTGRFASKKYVKSHKATTERETRWK
jgi:hypothetical protein